MQQAGLARQPACWTVGGTDVGMTVLELVEYHHVLLVGSIPVIGGTGFVESRIRRPDSSEVRALGHIRVGFSQRKCISSMVQSLFAMDKIIHHLGHHGLTGIGACSETSILFPASQSKLFIRVKRAASLGIKSFTPNLVVQSIMAPMTLMFVHTREGATASRRE